MSLILAKLRHEDINEKIVLNEKSGIDIYALRASIKDELKDFQWAEIRAMVQCQSFVEQLEHIENMIKQFEQTGVKEWVPVEIIAPPAPFAPAEVK